MDNSLQNYRDMMSQANTLMEAAIEKMPLHKYDQWFKPQRINPLFLTFDQLNWELPFHRLPDPLFRFYLVAAILGFIAMVITQALTGPKDPIVWVIYGVAFCVLLLLFPITWVDYIWGQLKDPYSEMDAVPEPNSTLIRFFHRTSRKLVTFCLGRVLIFLVVCLILPACAIMQMMSYQPMADSDSILSSNSSTPSLFENHVSPWHLTQTCTLAITVCYLFLRIHFILKLFISSITVTLHAIIVTQMPIIFQDLNSTSPAMDSQTAHILYIISITIFFHLMDRQVEYMNRLDFLWKKKLTIEQEKASETHMVNKALLENILPIHVAELYLNPARNHDQLYHEEYNSIAVMFASIPNYVDFYSETELNDGGIQCLKCLNEIIGDFDELLFKPQFLRVEKIKLVGSTYMAAHGLQPGRRGSSESNEDSTSLRHNVVIMAKFAAEMMSALYNINKHALTDFKLRIGIDFGPVIAGVVGAQKPFYDIWGDSVNIASRMDSTGVMGAIQVTETTAKILKDEGISCTLRGSIPVKGKGLMRTYFVDVNEHFEVIESDRSSVDLNSSNL